MPTISPFTPQSGTTVNLVASTASQNVALPSGGGSQIRVLNNASTVVFIALGTSTVTASTSTDMPVLSGAPPEKFSVDPNSSKITYLAVAASATAGVTGALYVTRGEGF